MQDVKNIGKRFSSEYNAGKSSSSSSSSSLGSKYYSSSGKKYKKALQQRDCTDARRWRRSMSYWSREIVSFTGSKRYAEVDLFAFAV